MGQLIDHGGGFHILLTTITSAMDTPHMTSLLHIWNMFEKLRMHMDKAYYGMPRSPEAYPEMKCHVPPTCVGRPGVLEIAMYVVPNFVPTTENTRAPSIQRMEWSFCRSKCVETWDKMRHRVSLYIEGRNSRVVTYIGTIAYCSRYYRCTYLEVPDM